MGFREAVRFVALLNIVYFGVEIFVGLWTGSVAMFADSIDFLEDAAVNLLVLISIGWSPGKRSTVGMLMAALLLVPCAATFLMAGYKYSVPFAPSPLPLVLIGIGAMLINVGSAYVLAICGHAKENFVRAALMATRYDILANLAITGAGIATALYPTAWPDLFVGVCIGLLNVDAVRRVYWAAHKEHDLAVGANDK
jgi:Co/Zn/Cd efflux system component